LTTFDVGLIVIMQPAIKDAVETGKNITGLIVFLTSASGLHIRISSLPFPTYAMGSGALTQVTVVVIIRIGITPAVTRI
jgi:hypothetical protein